MMKFNPRMKVRQVASENIVMRMGLGEADMTTVMALNDSSMLIYNHFGQRPFTTDEVVALMQEEYEVDEATARRDIEEWEGQMRQYELIVDA